MKLNQKNRYNGRYNNRNNRVMIMRNTALESSGPCGKLHGTALQLFEKYQTAAKDALIQNDLVLAQICLQHADHYMRLQNIAIANEQAMRTNYNNNNNNTAGASESTESEVVDEIPEFTTEEKPVAETENEPVEKEETTGDAKKDDLSVPVEQMQAQQAKPAKKPTRVVRKTVKAKKPTEE